MKKALIFFLLIIAWAQSQAQYISITATPQTATVSGNKKLRFVWGTNIFNVSDSIAAATGALVPGGPITSLPTIGYNPGTNLNAAAWIVSSYYRSANPTATLTGGGNVRVTSAATTNSNLSYAYGKVTGTLNIASATINGSTAGVTQNANGASGTYVANVPTASFSTTTYTLLVTTVDSKTASDAVSFTVLNDRFWFRSASATPDATTIQAAAGGGSGLSASKAGSFSIIASGSNYPGFAYPARLGTLSSIKDANNVEVISGYNTGTLSITTAGGYSESYRYYINQNATTGNTTMVTQ